MDTLAGPTATAWCLFGTILVFIHLHEDMKSNYGSVLAYGIKCHTSVGTPGGDACSSFHPRNHCWGVKCGLVFFKVSQLMWIVMRAWHTCAAPNEFSYTAKIGLPSA
jgi:hypothetical protein